MVRVPGASESVRNFMKLYLDGRFGANGISIPSLEHARKELVRSAKEAVRGRSLHS